MLTVLPFLDLIFPSRYWFLCEWVLSSTIRKPIRFESVQMRACFSLTRGQRLNSGGVPGTNRYRVLKLTLLGLDLVAFGLGHTVSEMDREGL